MARILQATNSLSSPAWAGDFLNREHLLPGGAKLLASAYNSEDASVVTVTAIAAIAAVSIAVTALTKPIPSGTVLRFSIDEFATTTAAVGINAVSIPVEALVSALEIGDTATYAGILNRKSVASGTFIGRTYAERDAGTAFGPAADADDEFYLVAFDVQDLNDNTDVDCYRPGGIVKENFLPIFATLSTALKAKIRSLYQCTRGVQ